MSCKFPGADALQGTMSDLDLLTPTPVQAAAIPALLSGKNAAIQSYTGSGKVRLPSASIHVQVPEDHCCQGRKHDQMQPCETQGQALCPRCPRCVQRPPRGCQARTCRVCRCGLTDASPSQCALAWHGEVASLLPCRRWPTCCPPCPERSSMQKQSSRHFRRRGRPTKQAHCKLW